MIATSGKIFALKAVALAGFALAGTEIGFARSSAPDSTSLPVEQIERIIQAEGMVSGAVLSIDISRDDIGNVQGPRGVIFTPDFEVHGTLDFQPLKAGGAFLNGDLALREEEVNPFIAALLTNGIVFQAFHQHTPSTPQVWFVHFRGTGDPLVLARSIKAAINVTATPFPQTSPEHPTTPLNPDELASILHGDASVGDGGVVTVTVLRKRGVSIDGVYVSPETNISTNIEFKPVGNGSRANVVPDFSMTADETVPVITLMLTKFGWYQGCLYNQETDEKPQLYFDHMVKSGDAYQLAREIRRGLDLTDAE